jgi:lipase ATG15
MVDLELWCAAVLLEIFLPFVPFIGHFNYIAHDYFSMLMAMPRVVFQPFSLTDRYVHNMFRYVRHVRVGEGDDVLITGHSLGGGIAKILALMTGYAAVAWSGPGTRAIEYLYRDRDKTITPRNLINVVPDQDWVGAVDQWDGTTYKLPCRAGPLWCHDLPRTICQVAAMCGKLDEQRPWCELWLEPRDMEQVAENAAPHHVQFDE